MWCQLVAVALETLALSELHQHKLQVCENNWIRRIAGVMRVERRRMKDLRGEVVTKACIVSKIVKSRVKWAGHMVRMKDDKLPKRSDTKKQEGCRKRGRPRLRWEDCVKLDLRKAVVRKGQQQGPMKTNYKSSRTSEWPVDQADPYTREDRGRTILFFRLLNQSINLMYICTQK